MDQNSTEEIIEDLRQGRMVVIMDDADRENEGDLIMAAELVTPKRSISWRATDAVLFVLPSPESIAGSCACH